MCQRLIALSLTCAAAFMLQVVRADDYSVLLERLTLILIKRKSAVKTMLAAATMMPAPAPLGLLFVTAKMYTL
jgi:hypothetical protein